MPFGYVPLMICMDGAAELPVGKQGKATIEEAALFGAWSVLPIFDGRDASRHSSKMLAQVEAGIVRLEGTIHKCVKSRTDFVAWRSGLQLALNSGEKVVEAPENPGEGEKAIVVDEKTRYYY